MHKKVNINEKNMRKKCKNKKTQKSVIPINQLNIKNEKEARTKAKSFYIPKD